MLREYNVLALVKGTERYVYLYLDDNHADLLHVLEEHASNPLLSFNWFDAAVLKQRSMQQLEATSEENFNRQIRSTEAT